MAKSLLERLLWKGKQVQGFPRHRNDHDHGDLSQLLTQGSWLPLLLSHVLPHLTAGEQAALRLTCTVARELPITAVTQLRLRLSQHSVVMPSLPAHVYPSIKEVHVQEWGHCSLRVDMPPVPIKQQLAAVLTGRLAHGVMAVSVNLQYFSVRNAQEVVLALLHLLPNITAMQVDNWSLPSLACIPLAASSKLQSLIARPTFRGALEPQHSAAHSMDSLAGMTQLQLLSIARPYLHLEDNLKFLTSLTNLTTLSLYEAYTDYDQLPQVIKLQALSVLTGLQNLSLTLSSTTSMQLSTLTCLSHLSRLQLLDYAYCQVDELVLDLSPSLSCISSLPKLADLTITYNALPVYAYVDISVFGACRHLTHLGYSGSEVVGPVGPDMFPALSSLECYAEFNPHLSSLTRLQSLIWHDDYRWGYRSASFLDAGEECVLLEGLTALTGLTRLVVHDAAERRFGDATRSRSRCAALPQLLSLTNLQQLHLCFPSLGRSTLATAAQLTSLTKLELCTCWTQRQPPRVLVTGKDMLQLSAATQLKHLTLRHMDCVPTAYLVALVKTLKNLDTLEVFKSCMVSREGARWLTRKCMETSGARVKYTATTAEDSAIKRMGCMCFVCWYQFGDAPAVVRQSCMAGYRMRGLVM